MSNLNTLNCQCTLGVSSPVKGMIDANAYHSSPATWPEPLTYVVINVANETEPVRFINNKMVADKLMFIDGINIRHRSTAEVGNHLIRLNSRMFNEENPNNTVLIKDLDEQFQIQEDIKKLLNGRNREDLKDKEERSQLNDLEEREKELARKMADVYREDIPSLIIASTMDMEFAHIDGYDGEFIYQQDDENGNVFYEKYGIFSEYLSDDGALMFQNWKLQISDIEVVAASHPSRYFPLFSYDPRRYRYAVNTPRDYIIKGCGSWKEPFARIVGHGDSADGIKKIWLGFCMNPGLGFRPFDEFCEYLPKFYSECEKNNIPILAHCVPGGMTAHEAEYYPDKTDERMDKSEERHEMILKENLSAYQGDALCSCMYYGEESVVNGDKYKDLDYFYINHGHPRNWIPVLEYFPKLRLCLAGFGGNSEWQLAEWTGNEILPTRHWIRCIIELTKHYENVYADISGLNIYDEKIKSGLWKMLELIQDDKNGEFGHLKHKLIFGSGWYLTYLTDVADGGTDINGWINVRHSYSNYCSEFKSLFYAADKGGTGELWEHVSLINPETFYALSEEKINNIHNELLNIDKNNTPDSQTPDEREDTPSQTPTQNEDGRYKPAPDKLTKAAHYAVDQVNNDKTYTYNGIKDSACNIGVNHAFKKLTNSTELQGKKANAIYDYFVNTKPSNFKKVEIGEVSALANQGHIVFAVLKDSPNGHISMAVPGGPVSGNWYGKDYVKGASNNEPILRKVPVMMDTGINKRYESVAISQCFGGEKHHLTQFFQYIKTI